jgi:hypothetical protein
MVNSVSVSKPAASAGKDFPGLGFPGLGFPGPGFTAFRRSRKGAIGVVSISGTLAAYKP